MGAELTDPDIKIIAVIDPWDSVAIDVIISTVGHAVPVEIREASDQIVVAVLIDVITDLGGTRVDRRVVVRAVLRD